jgi:hypothetical protein
MSQELNRDNDSMIRLVSNKSKMIGRLGSTEAWLVAAFDDEFRRISSESEISFLHRTRIRRHAWFVAGLWPPVASQGIQFSDAYTNAVRDSDAMVIWRAKQFLPQEDELINHYAQDTELLSLPVLNVFKLVELGIAPWINTLDGKRVLVVHREKNLIEAQYEKRKRLHRNFALPEFGNLTVWQPPQTNGFHVGLKTWFDHFFESKDELTKLVQSRQFDVALVSAGSYGMPISQHLKAKGVTSVYMGGILQMLFGIWGSRWKGSKLYDDAETDAWVWPSKENRPFGFKLVERSSYW